MSCNSFTKIEIHFGRMLLPDLKSRPKILTRTSTPSTEKVVISGLVSEMYIYLSRHSWCLTYWKHGSCFNMKLIFQQPQKRNKHIISKKTHETAWIIGYTYKSTSTASTGFFCYISGHTEDVIVKATDPQSFFCFAKPKILSKSANSQSPVTFFRARRVTFWKFMVHETHRRIEGFKCDMTPVFREKWGFPKIFCHVKQKITAVKLWKICQVRIEVRGASTSWEKDNLSVGLICCFLWVLKRTHAHSRVSGDDDNPEVIYFLIANHQQKITLRVTINSGNPHYPHRCFFDTETSKDVWAQLDYFFTTGLQTQQKTYHFQDMTFSRWNPTTSTWTSRTNEICVFFVGREIDKTHHLIPYKYTRPPALEHHVCIFQTIHAFFSKKHKLVGGFNPFEKY